MERKEALRAELVEAVKKRDDLNIYIRILQERLGETVGDLVPGTGDVSSDDSTAQPQVGAFDPLTTVYPGMFFGMSQSKATRKLLEQVRRPLTTTAILDCLAKGGMNIGGKNPRINLWTVLKRSAQFMRVPKAGWGLAEWYPEKLVAKSKKVGDKNETDNGDTDEK